MDSVWVKLDRPPSADRVDAESHVIYDALMETTANMSMASSLMAMGMFLAHFHFIAEDGKPSLENSLDLIKDVAETLMRMNRQ